MPDASLTPGPLLDIVAGEARAQRALALAGVKPRPGDTDAAHEFEGYMLRLLLAEMRRTVSAGGLFDGRATSGYQAMLDEALTRQAAARGGLGLANQLLAQWDRQR